MSQCSGITLKNVRCLRKIMCQKASYYCNQHLSQIKQTDPIPKPSEQPKASEQRDQPKPSEQPKPNEQPKASMWKLTYSKSLKKVNVFRNGRLLVCLPISNFNSKYIVPYMKHGSISILNPFNLTQENVEYFVLKMGENRLEVNTNQIGISQADETLLKIQGIKDKNDYRKWMIKNHPDRNPDNKACTDLFAKIVKIGKVKF